NIPRHFETFWSLEGPTGELPQTSGYTSTISDLASAFYSQYGVISSRSCSFLRELSGKQENSSAELPKGKTNTTKKRPTPEGHFDKVSERTEKHPHFTYPPFPDYRNPKTGEIGGPSGPEPTRYGDWERKGRVSDF
ncbi:PREDICTED: succinate dehydrogenase assembly factor 4, mitochondrial-like, partial [Priapulus caudatus]|uniref:Succinate dehydrogenase assembly factor 4, mitochondrial n=1 Tax=Priapulus caudatus TaxID=37621 RepID=A0ABM1DSI8_PRICU